MDSYGLTLHLTKGLVGLTALQLELFVNSLQVS